MSDISNYKVDHLLLLVGSNPLPNAVAGRLLTTTAGTITLIHSKKDGLELAQRLQSSFLAAGSVETLFNFIEVEESEAGSVCKGVRNALQKYETDHGNANKVRLGLNYTGGTKVMSVHAYHTLESWADVHKTEAIFSYLDARTLHMCFDPAPGRGAASFYVGLKVEFGIDELLRLHNWKSNTEPVRTPVLPESAAALLTIHSDTAKSKKWTEWLQNMLFRSARTSHTIESPFWVFQSGKELPGQYIVKQAGPGDDWKNPNQLRNKEIPWPDMSTLQEAMNKELGQHEAEYLNPTAVIGRGCESEKEFCRWLSGNWLESVVLSILQHCSQELHLNECCMDIRPKPLDSAETRELFQFDVVAIRGYQLFAFSCTTEGRRKDILKQKLFEVYVRARQMGGDEACAALVCCMEQEKADKLKDEVSRDLSPEGRIRVFGRECLANLSEHIARWVQEQSKGD